MGLYLQSIKELLTSGGNYHVNIFEDKYRESEEYSPKNMRAARKYEKISVTCNVDGPM